MRSREISSIIIIQNFAQLKALFKDTWETIPGNCDTFIYLGGNEQSTHKYVSELLGKGTIDKKSSGETKGRQGSSSRNYDVLGRELFTPCLLYTSFYEKGVPVQTIKEVMDKGEKPITMRRLYEEVLEMCIRDRYYSKGDLVATLTTGKDGKAVAKNLPLGKYKVVEVTAPNGYVLNPNEQTVTFAYVDDQTPVIKESLTFSNDRQKLDMSVTKLDSEDNTPIAGAVFGLYADEDIKNVDGKVIIEKGTLLEKATSDENGKIAFVKDYPFAKYVAKEIEKPAGYVTNEEVVTFDTKYQGQDVKTAVYSSEYKNIPTTFEFTKTDITSGAELSGATLTVLDKDGNVVDTCTSDAKEAHVIKKLVVGETYTLREEFAPYGYLKATDIPVSYTHLERYCRG